MRYLGQNYELELPVDVDALRPTRPPSGCGTQFHDAHRARFGFNIPGEIIEIVNFSATVVSRTAETGLPAHRQRRRARRRRRSRAVWFIDGAGDTPVLTARRCAPGSRSPGRRSIEEAASVTVLDPGQHRLTSTTTATS